MNLMVMMWSVWMMSNWNTFKKNDNYEADFFSFFQKQKNLNSLSFRYYDVSYRFKLFVNHNIPAVIFSCLKTKIQKKEIFLVYIIFHNFH